MIELLKHVHAEFYSLTPLRDTCTGLNVGLLRW